MAKIIPGILTANEKEYHKRLLIAEHVSDLVQIDVIDGKFAPNITITSKTIKNHAPSCQLEIQLMVVDPLSYINELGGLDYVSRIIFAFETEHNIDEMIYAVHNFGTQVGLSINPSTPIDVILPFYRKIDLLSIYAANPGFSGQKLQYSTYSRVSRVKLKFPDLPVEVDIGVNESTVPKLVQAGADFLVATSYLNNAKDYYLAYEKLAKLASKPT